MYEGEITEQEIHAFVGRSSDSYIRYWQPALSGTGPPRKFKAAAFWLSCFWVGYRKMYKVAAIIYGIILVESILEIVIFEGVLGMPEAPGGLTAIVGLSVGLVSGTFGNSWYWSHTKQVIEDVRMMRLDEQEHLVELSRRGGTSIATAVGLFVLYMLVAIVVVFIMVFIMESGSGGGLEI